MQVFNDDETKKTFYYKLNVPTLAHGISMAVGPFEVLPDPKIGYVTHFCLPGKMKQLINCVSFFHQVHCAAHPARTMISVALSSLAIHRTQIGRYEQTQTQSAIQIHTRRTSLGSRIFLT